MCLVRRAGRARTACPYRGWRRALGHRRAVTRGHRAAFLLAVLASARLPGYLETIRARSRGVGLRRCSVRLVLCSHCQRHVRAEDGSCPFCGERTRSPVVAVATVAAALIVGLGVAAGCSGSTDDSGGNGGDGGSTAAGGDGGSTATGGVAGAYGPPPGDAQSDVETDAGDDDSGMIAAYGPPPDSGGSGGAYGPPPP